MTNHLFNILNKNITLLYTDIITISKSILGIMFAGSIAMIPIWLLFIYPSNGFTDLGVIIASITIFSIIYITSTIKQEHPPLLASMILISIPLIYLINHKSPLSIGIIILITISLVTTGFMVLFLDIDKNIKTKATDKTQKHT